MYAYPGILQKSYLFWLTVNEHGGSLLDCRINLKSKFLLKDEGCMCNLQNFRLISMKGIAGIKSPFLRCMKNERKLVEFPERCYFLICDIWEY